MTEDELIEQIYKILRDVKLGGIDCRVATVIVSDICKAHYSNEWIPVSERLPDNKSYVLAHDGEGYSGAIIAFHHSGNFYRNSISQDRLRVKHWMPLPESPTQ